MVSKFSETLVSRKLFVDAGWTFFPLMSLNNFRESSTVILCVPPHTAYILQTLGRLVFKPI